MKTTRFVVGAVIISFVGAFISQPVVLTWLGKHPIYDALVAAGGVAFHAYNTYVTPSAGK